jgi:hypothetical protein
MIFTRWSVRRGFWFYWFIFGLMRIVAVGTKIIGSFARPHKVSRPFPMNSCSPISILGTMTLPTEPIALSEVYEFSVVEPEPVSISCIMAIETPSHGLGMAELDLTMFFF